MPLKYPITINQESELVLFLATLTPAELHSLLINSIWPAIKSANKAARRRPGPAPAMSRCYYEDGQQLTRREHDQCSIGQKLWLHATDGKWYLIEKTSAGRKHYWGRSYPYAKPPFYGQNVPEHIARQYRDKS